MGEKSPSQFSGRKNGEIFVLTEEVTDETFDVNVRKTIANTDKDAPFPFRILDIHFILLAAGVSGGQVVVEIGDGAMEETWTRITDVMSTDSKSVNNIVRVSSLPATSNANLVPKFGSLSMLSVSGDNHKLLMIVLCRREDA